MLTFRNQCNDLQKQINVLNGLNDVKDIKDIKEIVSNNNNKQ